MAPHAISPLGTNGSLPAADVAASPIMGDVDPSLRLRAQAIKLNDLFAGADTHHGTCDAQGTEKPVPGRKVEIKAARTVKSSPTPDLWERHLAGDYPLGVSPLRKDDTCIWGVIDVDQYDLSLAEVVAAIAREKLPLVTCRSKSGGAHLFLFLTSPAPAVRVQKVLMGMAQRLDFSRAEIFPKQTQSSGKFSNWLNMPYFDGDNTYRYALKPRGATMVVSEFLERAAETRTSLEAAEALSKVRAVPARTSEALKSEAETKLHWWSDRVANAPRGDANNTLTRAAFDLGRYARDTEVSSDQMESVLRAAWRSRGKDDNEFDLVFRRQLQMGAEKGRPTISKEAETAVVTCLADVAPQPITWLWPGRFARGKVSMLAGHPGVGKSQLAVWIAARVTVGGEWPFDEGRAPAGSVVMLSAEDDIADTMRPRFDAAGADPSKVDVLEAMRRNKGVRRGFDLGVDLAALEHLIKRRDDVRLVVIDPVSAYVGKIDSNRNADVRAVLAPLQALAERHRVAVICVSHLIKASGRAAIGSVTGSGAFVAAARTACIVTKEIEDEVDAHGGSRKTETGRRLLTVAKNNIGPDGATQALAYTVEVRVTASGIAAPVVVWDSTANITADEALNPSERGPRERPRDRAKMLLRHLLRDGALPAVEVEEAARMEGIKPDTLRNAKKDLQVATNKSPGRAGGWLWSLPGRQEELPI